jgi:hypothetical protein
MCVNTNSKGMNAYKSIYAAIFRLLLALLLRKAHSLPYRAMNFAKGKTRDDEKGTGRRVRQRSALEEEHSEPDADMEDLRRNMEVMTTTVGTGVHAQSILAALSMSTTTNARDIANLQAAVTKNYEIPPDSKYITLPKECMKLFAEHCKQQKGKAEHTGHPKNYALVGLVEALIADPSATEEEKAAAHTVRNLVSNKEDEVDMNLSKEIAHIASYCQVVQTPRKGFINIALFQSEDNDKLMEAFDRVWRKIGKRQYDPPPPKPVNKDIRKWASDQKGK